FNQYGFKHETGIDSEVLLHLFRKKLTEIQELSTNVDGVPIDVHFKGTPLEQKSTRDVVHNMDREVAIQESLSELSGGYAYGLVDLTYPEVLFLFRNFKPLTLCYQTDDPNYCDLSVLWFNSEKKNILKGL